MMKKIRYILFKLLCKKRIEEAWEEAEYITRREFFERADMLDDDKFIEAYEKVWLPLYNEYIKR